MNIKKNSLFFVILCLVVSNMTFAAEENPSKKRKFEGVAFADVDVRMGRVQAFLDTAIENNDLDAIAVLINLEYPVSAEDIDNNNFLHLAVENPNDNPEVIKTFIEAGADINRINSRPYSLGTPLHEAVANNNNTAVAILLAAGANPNIERSASTLLIDTLDFDDLNIELFYLLIAAPAIDVNYTTLHGKTALSALVASYRSERNRRCYGDDLRTMAQALWAKNPSILGLGQEDRDVINLLLALQAPVIDLLAAADALESDLSQED